MIILLHSSKTMNISHSGDVQLTQPLLLDRAKELDVYLKTLSAPQLEKCMKLSPALAKKVHTLIADWTADQQFQSVALDSFIGDIYSGLQAPSFSSADRDYANKTLRILSGLYGIIRPYDGIYPYRLEMGYKFPDPKFANLYDYWGPSIAAYFPRKELIINLASDEFFDAVKPFVDEFSVIAPRFLTVSPKTGEPVFVAIHAKIARGAFARWLILSRTSNVDEFKKFQDLGYSYDEELSTASSPTFVCKGFGGKGLSIK